MQDVDFSGKSTVSQIAERLNTSARVDVVYGEERKIGDKTIIPIAVVAYMFGGGAGGGVAPHENGASNSTSGGGGGGGGGVRVQPVAVLEVTGDDTRVLPVMDWTRIITTGITIFGAWMLIRSIFRRGR
jgi:uncharacterized spore protein YtfJ